MSQFSTSKMLGKLGTAIEGKAQSEVLVKGEEIKDFGEPQLQPSQGPVMEDVLANIFRQNFSKKYSPIDK